MKIGISTKGRIWCSAVIMLLCCFVFSCQLQAQEVVVAEGDSPESVVSIQKQPSKASHRKRTKVATPGAKLPSDSLGRVVDMMGDTVYIADMDSIQKQALAEELWQRELQAKRDSAELADYGRERVMKINPTRALWLSALCPGLGQVYNRRYWKLPIVVGGFVGMTYAISWNSKMLKDYTKAYNDAMDSDPTTNSYMDFYPPTVQESDIDVAWLKKSLKAKKDYFRRNRDLCIIGVVGVYLVCIVDAYVDASMAKFDVSDDLSMKVKPTFIPQCNSRLPGVGVACAFNF